MTAELLFLDEPMKHLIIVCQKNSEPYQPLFSNLGGRGGLSPELESLLSVHSVD